MFKRNLILVIRLLFRRHIYSVINLLGLPLGMACFFVIVLFYQYQNSYDQFHSKKDHIFKLNRSINQNYGNEISRIASNTSKSLTDYITGVEKITRLVDIQSDLQYGNIGVNIIENIPSGLGEEDIANGIYVNEAFLLNDMAINMLWKHHRNI